MNLIKRILKDYKIGNQYKYLNEKDPIFDIDSIFEIGYNKNFKFLDNNDNVLFEKWFLHPIKTIYKKDCTQFLNPYHYNINALELHPEWFEKIKSVNLLERIKLIIIERLYGKN